MPRKPPYTLVFTDPTFRVARRSYPHVPLLVSRQGVVVEPASDWLRSLAVHHATTRSTLQQYASILQLYWNHLGNRRWDRIDDHFLLEWRNEQETLGVHRGTINERLRLVFRFYWWAQQNGYVRDLIGEADWDHEGRKVPPPIRAAVRRSGGGDGVTRTTYTSNLLYRNTGRARNAHTPTGEETARVHEHLADTAYELSVRNTLMASWAEELGLRRKEFAALRVAQIPREDTIRELLESAELYPMELVVTKGQKNRSVPVTPELLLRTWDFIVCERADMIAAIQKRNAAYRPPEEIFLSSRTGEVMNLTAISNLLGRAFRAAKVPGWGHRLRARFLTNLTEAYFQIEYDRNGNKYNPETILLKVAEVAGHERMETLRPYLNLVAKRFFETDEAQRFVNACARDLSRTRLLQERIRQLARMERLEKDLAEVIGAEAATRAAGVMSQLLRELASGGPE